MYRQGPTGYAAAVGNSQYTYDGYTFAPGQNVFSQAQLDTAAQKLAQAYPCPNYSPAGTANFGINQWRMADWKLQFRDDSRFGSDIQQLPGGPERGLGSDQLGWQAGLEHQQPRPGHFPRRLPAHHQHLRCAPGPHPRRNRKQPGHFQNYVSANYMLSETHTFSPTLINEFRFVFNWGNDAEPAVQRRQQHLSDLRIERRSVQRRPAERRPAGSIHQLDQAFGAHGNDPAA